MLTEDQISLVPLIGREVNGVVGADFFQNHPVWIDYLRERLTIYRDIDEVPRSKKKIALPMNVTTGKPIIQAGVSGTESSNMVNVLVDTGSGDSLWLFGDKARFATADKSFEAYLGLGVSGEVFGLRTKSDYLEIGQYQFNDITTAFPEVDFLSEDQSFDGTTGSVGNEVLRRFHVVLDYPNRKMYLAKNADFGDGFYYNMLGITVKEGEKDLITSTKAVGETSKTEARSQVTVSPTAVQIRTYKLVPKIVVSYVNPGSLADRNGIKMGDEIIRLNYRRKGSFTMNDLFRYMYNRPYSNLRLQIKRGDQVFKRKMRLVPIIN